MGFGSGVGFENRFPEACFMYSSQGIGMNSFWRTSRG